MCTDNSHMQNNLRSEEVHCYFFSCKTILPEGTAAVTDGFISACVSLNRFKWGDEGGNWTVTTALVNSKRCDRCSVPNLTVGS